MFRTRCLVALAVAFACGAMALPSLAQDKQEQKKKRGGGAGGFGGFGKGQGTLVSDNLQEKLNLTAEQKSSVTKLNAEFKDKSQPINDKLTELRKKAFQDKDADARKEMGEQSKALQTLRTDYQAKVNALLNDDQKKTYEDSKKAGRFGGFGGGFGGFGGGGTPGQILSSGMQDRLKLTQEQKDKLAKIQKDVDAKLNDVLTPEQKKQLEELKNPAPKGPKGKGANILEALQQFQGGNGVNVREALEKLQGAIPDLANGVDAEQLQQLQGLLQQLRKRAK